MTDSDTLHRRLRTDIERSGYYPTLVSDALETAMAGELLVSYVVHHEATFDRDELRRHVTVLVLTPTRLIVGHTDEHGPDDTCPDPYASASTEAVRLEKVETVVVTRVGAIARIDLEPAGCSDSECDADHGYTGTASNDDLSLRVSEAADGPAVVSQTLAFAAALSEATAARLR